MSALLTRREEYLNMLTHGMMAVLIAVATPFVLSADWRAESSSRLFTIPGTAVFCACMILMFGMSAIYHGLPAMWRSKRVFKRLDHMSIYFAIAGSYTPIALSVIGGTAGRSLLITEWSLVIAGILFKSFFFRQSRLTATLSTAVYLLMGWAILPWLPIFLAKAETGCVILIIAGGLLYTAGVAFFALRRKYAHTVWHLFVNAGAICHFLAIIFFAG